jgi:hypothetical protein
MPARNSQEINSPQEMGMSLLYHNIVFDVIPTLCGTSDAPSSQGESVVST